MERPTHQGLRHLALNARDLDAMKHFYVELLGFSVEWEPDADNIYLSSGIDNLALHRTSNNAGFSPRGALPSFGASPALDRRGADRFHREPHRHGAGPDDVAHQCLAHEHLPRGT